MIISAAQLDTVIQRCNTVILCISYIGKPTKLTHYGCRQPLIYWYGGPYDCIDEASACKRVSFNCLINCNKIVKTVFIDLIYGFHIRTVKSNIIRMNEMCYLNNVAHSQNCGKIIMNSSKNK